ncbi:MAG: hypothetical protein SFV15_06645 [Polyangiaceae bacterium]|nr:hypothetical protein [Polyangiaceae bacterium]
MAWADIDKVRSWCVVSLTLVMAAPACRNEPVAEVEFSLASPALRQRFEPRSSLAEYLELPAAGSELRITLSSYPLSCDAFRAPEDGEILVTITITTPPGVAITPRAYPWEGTAEGVPPRAEGQAEPIVRIGKKSWALEPGGQVKIRQAALDRQGSVSGILDLEFPGTAQQSASRLSGAFEAKLCQVERRNAPQRE